MNQASVTAIAGILILATLAESLVEYLIAPPVDELADDKPWREIAMRYIAALVGILLAVTYQTDLLAMLGLTSPWPWVGWVVTGLLIGRGANFVHDFASRWLSAQLR
jgi:hypothetical protein